MKQCCGSKPGLPPHETSSLPLSYIPTPTGGLHRIPNTAATANEEAQDERAPSGEHCWKSSQPPWEDSSHPAPPGGHRGATFNVGSS